MNILFRIETTNLKTDDIIEYDFAKDYFKSKAFTYTLADIRTFIMPKETLVDIMSKKTRK